MIKDYGRILIILTGCLLFLAGFAVSRLNLFNLGNCNSSKYKLINTSLDCDYRSHIGKSDYNKLRNNLSNFIQWKKQTGDLAEASVYFRDLEYGPTMGIREYSMFSPASLLKLPILFTYLSYNESHPDEDIMDKEITYQDVKNLPVAYFTPKISMQVGKPYKVNDLLGYMIKYSDNVSASALTLYLEDISPTEDLLKNTFVDLGILEPAQPSDQTVNVKSYANLFLDLYNASAFDKKETSERALELLSQSDFNKGIVAGVPIGIKVAHKFGERLDSEANIKQLHDCGIVYYPDNPYLLCIMTRGYDFDKLAVTISAISRQVYEEVNSRKL
ncbi:class A beta-lactamase-related serine hydrolase [Candidatus Parcubacteria bacterium]|nr:class A beta-lactamase-related serine hydrolase [Candidatus Parcubacteria bacterium]